MKKSHLVLSICLALLALACSSDDDGQNPTASRFTLNGTSYDLPNGFILSAFDGTNISRHAIYLINGSIINNEWYGDACDFSNDLTHGVIFNITSSSVTELANGTYNYQLNSTVPSLNESAITTNVVVENNCVISFDDIDEEQITSGSLTVERTNNIYTLNFTFETDSSVTITGSYEGELQLTQDLSD